MKTEAIITMVLAQGFITIMAAYFFYRVLTSKPKNSEEDSFEKDQNKDTKK